MALKMISLNIERSLHCDPVLTFLKQTRADVVCLQELMQYDIPRFEKELGVPCIFAGSTRHPGEGKLGVMGLGTFTRLPVVAQKTEYYWGSPESFGDYSMGTLEAKHNSEKHFIIWCDVQFEGAVFRIGTTHFTWTPDGQPDDLQRIDLAHLLPLLEMASEFVFCGDFNAPRGGEIFSALAGRYTDNIPLRYKTSLDLALHRAGNTDGERLARLMVDGLFTTPAYRASNVELVSGVSDHCAIVADIEKVA